MATITQLVKLKKPTKRKHKQWCEEQHEYAQCINDCTSRLLAGEALSSKNVPFGLKSAIKTKRSAGQKRLLPTTKKETPKRFLSLRLAPRSVSIIKTGTQR
jgi:putative transposase